VPEFQGQVILTLGLLLSAALLGGLIAERLRLPKVTAYLIVGLLLGPYTLESLPRWVSDWVPDSLFRLLSVPESHLAFLDPVGKFAMALVLFNMGCSFTLSHIRPHFRSIMRLSFGELMLTFVLVAIGLSALGESWQSALLFGCLAMATAPATTVLVLKENHSEGPVTQYAHTLVALNNIASVVAFEVLFVAVLTLDGRVDVSLKASLGRLCLDLVGSVTLGVIAGLSISTACGFLLRGRWLVMLVAIAATGLGLCQLLELPYLLTFLVMGTTVANTSDRVKDLIGQIDGFTGLLCVVFFVIHGAEMDIRALLAAGAIGVGYTIFRSLGKYFGIYLFATRTDGELVRRWLGTTLLSQAGAAIALTAIAAERYPELGVHLRDIILGTVVVFEIVGPIMIRQAVIRAGEVPLESAIHHRETTALDELYALTNRVLSALGLEPWSKRKLQGLEIGDLMRRRVRGIPASATFRRVIDFIERSHDDTLPVVNDENHLVGMISYRELRDEHFDPGLGSLVRAEDLAFSSFPILHPDQPAVEAWREFQKTKTDCLPIVSRERPHRLLGVLSRRDMLRLSVDRE
jgi:Kef-type K+ transport system membrane component KefB